MPGFHNATQSMTGTVRLPEALATTLRPMVSFAWRLVVTLTVCRAALVAWQWQRVIDADMLGNVFLQGLRFDPEGIANPGKVLPSPATCGDIDSVPEGAWI